MKLWLDDVREPWKHGCIGWEWVKTADEAIDFLQTGRVEIASLDHDLAPDHYPWSGVPIEKVTGTGYDVVLFLEANPQFWPKGGTRCHSMNPVGRQRMQVVIDRHYYQAPQTARGGPEAPAGGDKSGQTTSSTKGEAAE